MVREVQLPEPAAALLRTAREVAPAWLRRVTTVACERAAAGAAAGPEFEAMIAETSTALLDELDELLGTDVDEQRTTPLTLFRRSIERPTVFLRQHDVALPRVAPFDGERFPDDVYGLGPATWSDVDPKLHEPGLAWGAWKAMTVLARRRDEGLR